jgi:rRNA maturation endonuclease Nob1
VERPAAERAARRSEELSADTKVSEVLPLIESDLTIQEVAERLGIYVEPACALVRAATRSRQDGAQ